jgi:hypothetical protein
MIAVIRICLCKALSISHLVRIRTYYRQPSSPKHEEAKYRRSSPRQLQEDEEQSKKNGSPNDLSGGSVSITGAGNAEYEYVTGYRLYLVIGPVTLIALFLCWMAPLSRLSVDPPYLEKCSRVFVLMVWSRLFPVLLATLIPCLMLAGMAVHISWPSG